METGPCIEGDCIGALSCLSDLCVDPDPDAVTGGHAGEDTDGDPTGRDDDGDPPVPFDNEIDIIFMIDDSGSMAEEQLALVGAIEKLVERLESPAVNANYRIAFTTSDNGNPLCPTNFKTPEGGKFVLSSCRQRASHFTFSTVPPVEAFNAVCASPCAHETIEVLPTPTHLDDTSRPRPWIERNNTISNLPPNISTVEAVRCLAPMGIAGCGYEEQLESVYKAILRTQSAGEDQYGFIRPNAMLAIVLVSDEADGSYNRVPYGNFGPYDPNGNRVFWQDESAPAPSSAVSWNAGVQCTGSGSPYDDCYSQHYDIDGNVVSPQQAASQAVLHPVSRYIGLIEEIAESKISGEENRYSRTDLWDFKANVDGAHKIVELVRPLIEDEEAEYLATVDANFARVYDILETYEKGDGYVTYLELGESDRVTLAAAVNTLAEDLSTLRGKFGLD